MSDEADHVDPSSMPKPGMPTPSPYVLPPCGIYVADICSLGGGGGGIGIDWPLTSLNCCVLYGRGPCWLGGGGGGM